MPEHDGGYILPAVIDPPTFCITIQVPNDRQHIAAFVGALWELQFWWNWQKDSAHTARRVAKVWRRHISQALDRMDLGLTCEDVDATNNGLEIEDCMQLRIKPTDPCVIQSLCGDGTWEDWYDPRTCIPNAVAQQGPREQSAVGDCLEYDVKLDGSGAYHLPMPVSANDTIEITVAEGGWNDGTPQWYCASGFNYFLGLCGSAQPALSGDPLPGGNHMQLIALIDDVYYDAYNTTITVPAGLAAKDMIFQANDSVLTDNQGSISFHVKVCHNDPTPAADCFEYSFAASNQGFAPILSNAAFGTYVAGSPGYWQSVRTVVDGSHIYEQLRIKKAYTGTISSFKVHFDAAQPGYFEICDHESVPEGTFCPFLVAFPAGLDQTIEFSVGMTVATTVRIDLAHDIDAADLRFKLYDVEWCP